MTDSVTTQASPPSDMVILDLGRQERRRVRKLCKGEGRLLDKLNGVVGKLRDSSKIDRNAQIVVVVVREKADSESVFDIFD